MFEFRCLQIKLLTHLGYPVSTDIRVIIHKFKLHNTQIGFCLVTYIRFEVIFFDLTKIYSPSKGIHENYKIVNHVRFLD